MRDGSGRVTCRDCPSPVAGRFLRCPPHRSARLKAQERAAKTRWNQSPRGKVFKAAWADAHLDQVRATARRAYRKSHPRRVKRCATEGCTNRWIAKWPIQRRMFCLDCAVVFFGQHAKRRTDARTRQGERERSVA